MSETPWTFSGESIGTRQSQTITLVDGSSFLICDHSGDIGTSGTTGLFMLDTRVLSVWRLTINGRLVEPLSVTTNGPFSATLVGRIDDPTLADAPVTVIQRRHVGMGMREDLDIRNYGAANRQLRVELTVASDFANLFDVKAGRAVPIDRVGVLPTEDGVVIVHQPIERDDDFGGHGPDPVTVESTWISADGAPERVEAGSMIWEIELAPGEQWHNCVVVGVSTNGNRVEPSYRCGQPVDQAIPVSRLRRWREQITTINTDHRDLQRAVDQATQDLGALRIFDPDHPERVVVAAGAPWFMTLFGRDSLLTSWMALPLDQDLATGVLLELAGAQGQLDDPVTEEQPGRILHEVRFDPASKKMLGGQGRYYGSIDATPLFVGLVAELARWTGASKVVRDLIPSVDRAIAWMEGDGDRNGDGFIEYERRDPRGLENQGWKDSWDGIRHADGTVAVAPIALCEVQGYAYAAYRSRAALARSLGEPDSMSSSFDEKADHLRRRFDERFWLEEQGWFAVGLDRNGEPIASLSSNIGHLLWSGIVLPERARIVAERLVEPSMFSGWGIRTLSSDNRAYNPLSYHCGSVWPHDTAIAAAGLARYHCDDATGVIVEGLLSASAQSGGRLPELFAGFDREDLSTPVPYPASCSPQAWAAAAPLLLVRAMLGLDPDVPSGVVRLRPRVPAGIGRLELRDVPIAGGRVTVSVDGSDIVVTGLPDGLALEIDRP